MKEGGSRMLLVEAFHLAAMLVAYFEEKGIDVHPAGSLRRGATPWGTSTSSRRTRRRARRS